MWASRGRRAASWRVAQTGKGIRCFSGLLSKRILEKHNVTIESADAELGSRHLERRHADPTTVVRPFLHQSGASQFFLHLHDRGLPQPSVQITFDSYLLCLVGSTSQVALVSRSNQNISEASVTETPGLALNT